MYPPKLPAEVTAVTFCTILAHALTNLREIALSIDDLRTVMKRVGNDRVAKELAVYASAIGKNCDYLATAHHREVTHTVAEAERGSSEMLHGMMELMKRVNVKEDPDGHVS